MKMKTIIFDMDGTLSNPSHRQHFMNKEKKDWSSFYVAAAHDEPNKEILEMYLMYKMNPEYETVIVTGRPEKYRLLTIQWMNKHDIPMSEIYMRPDGDFQQDYTLKSGIYNKLTEEGHNIVLAIDDRQQVVDMWRAQGILCLQCAKGDF